MQEAFHWQLRHCQFNVQGLTTKFNNYSWLTTQASISVSANKTTATTKWNGFVNTSEQLLVLCYPLERLNWSLSTVIKLGICFFLASSDVSVCHPLFTYSLYGNGRWEQYLGPVCLTLYFWLNPRNHKLLALLPWQNLWLQTMEQLFF